MALAWCWFGTLLLAAIVIGLDKFYPLHVSSAVLFAVVLASGLILALGWAWKCRSQRPGSGAGNRSPVRAEGARQQQPGAQGGRNWQTAAGQAVVQDAVRRLERLDVAGQFRVRLGRWAWLPVVPALLAFGLATFLKPAVDENQAAATTSAVAQQKQIKKSGEVLRKKLEDRPSGSPRKGA